MSFNSLRFNKRKGPTKTRGSKNARIWLNKQPFTDRRHDYKNDYEWTDIGRIFYSEENMERLQNSIKKIVLLKLNVKIPNQSDIFLMEAMHENFHDVFEKKLQKTRTENNSARMFNATREWRYDPSKDEERGIIFSTRRTTTAHPKYKPNMEHTKKPMTLKQLLHQLNVKTIDYCIPIIEKNIKSKLWFHKFFNMSVYEKRAATGFMTRGGGKGLNFRNKWESMNKRQIPPVTFQDKFPINLYDDNYRY